MKLSSGFSNGDFTSSIMTIGNLSTKIDSLINFEEKYKETCDIDHPVLEIIGLEEF